MAGKQEDLEQDMECLNLESLSSSAKQELEEILHALVYGSLETKLRAAHEVKRLAKSSPKRRAYLAEAGAIAPLVSMLTGNSSVESLDASMQALLNLAVRNERNKVNIVKAGAIPLLVDLMQSEDANLRESAAVVILTLSTSDENKLAIGASGAIQLLVDMLIFGSLQGKVDAVMALYYLSTYPDNLSPILTPGAISSLIMLLKDCKKACKVAEMTTALLQSLTIFEEGRSAIVAEEGGVLALVEVLEQGSLAGREHAVSALLTMCQSSRCKYRQAILQEGAIPGLLQLTVQGTPPARKKAQQLLQLLRDPPQTPKSPPASAVLESIVYDIASHVDDAGKPGSVTAKKMLSEMVQLSMEQRMQHLKQRAMVSASSVCRSSRVANVANLPAK